MSDVPNISSVAFVKSATQRSHFPDDNMPQVAFCGRSNVGKSSLLNVLANRKNLARVSQTPGHTQLINFFCVNESMYFVDLPGYGFAKAPREAKKGWDEMISGYLMNNPRLRLALALLDIRRELGEDDYALFDWLRHYNIPFAVVLTKADKLPRSHQMTAVREFSKALAPYGPTAVLLFSASTRQGRDELLKLAVM